MYLSSVLFLYVVFDNSICQNIELLYDVHLHVAHLISATPIPARFPHYFYLSVKLNETPFIYLYQHYTTQGETETDRLKEEYYKYDNIFYLGVAHTHTKKVENQ